MSDPKDTQSFPQMTPTQEIRYLRSKAASNSVKKGAIGGSGAAVVSAYAAFRLASKYAIPLEIASLGVGLVVQGASSLFAYFARGGRKGESD